MRAIDTNVVARFLLDDDPVQSPIARDVIAKGVYIPLTVLLESAWLLISRYHQPRAVVASAMRALLDLPLVEIPEPALVRWAIDRYAAGADIADMLHIVQSRHQTGFASFEKRLERQAGPDAPVPIETLA